MQRGKLLVFRHDLIPNLVETVKTYMKHERSLLNEVTELSAREQNSDLSGDERVDLENKITKGISGIMVAVKNYPDLKVNQNFLQLQGMSSRGELVRLEDPEFKKECCVYSDDQVEARYILSTSLMKRILEFKQKWRTKVSLSFRDSKVYIAIRMNKNLFETRLFKSIVDYHFIE